MYSKKTRHVKIVNFTLCSLVSLQQNIGVLCVNLYIFLLRPAKFYSCYDEHTTIIQWRKSFLDVALNCIFLEPSPHKILCSVIFSSDVGIFSFSLSDNQKNFPVQVHCLHTLFSCQFKGLENHAQLGPNNENLFGLSAIIISSLGSNLSLPGLGWGSMFKYRFLKYSLQKLFLKLHF